MSFNYLPIKTTNQSFFMQKIYYFIAFAMLFHFVSGQTLTRGEAATQAVKMEYLSTQQVESHATYHRVNVSLKNRFNYPVWFIIPSFGEDKVAADGKITAAKPWKINFITGRTYADENSLSNGPKNIRRVVKIHFIGDKLSFYAFRLPAKGQIMIKNYEVGTFKGANSVQVIQTADIKVNGLLPLQKFLLYESESSDGAEVDCDANFWINVDWSEKDKINEWGNMQVDFLKISPLAVDEVKIK